MTAALLMAAAVLVWVRPPARFPAERGRSLPVVPTLVVVAAVAGVSVGAPEPAALILVLAGTAWGARRLWRQTRWPLVAAGTRERVLECCDLLAAELTRRPARRGGARAGCGGLAGDGPVAQCQAYGGDVPAALRRAAAEPGAEGMAAGRRRLARLAPHGSRAGRRAASGGGRTQGGSRNRPRRTR